MTRRARVRVAVQSSSGRIPLSFDYVIEAAPVDPPSSPREGMYLPSEETQKGTDEEAT